MKIDKLKDVIKRYPAIYANGYTACKRHNGNILYYLPPYLPGDDRRTAWTRGWGDRQTEEMKDV